MDPPSRGCRPFRKVEYCATVREGVWSKPRSPARGSLPSKCFRPPRSAGRRRTSPPGSRSTGPASPSRTWASGRSGSRRPRPPARQRPRTCAPGSCSSRGSARRSGPRGRHFPLWVWGDSEVGVGPAIAPEAGGGGGRTLGPATNTFGDGTTADRAAAEALRDAYAGANAAWLAQYDADRTFLILLRWHGGGEVVQRRNVRRRRLGRRHRCDSRSSRHGRGRRPRSHRHDLCHLQRCGRRNRPGLDGQSGNPVGALLAGARRRRQEERGAGHGRPQHPAGLVDVAGNAVVARQMTPGYLLATVYFAGQFSLAEVLHPRPQDYRAVFVVGEDAGDDDLGTADLATARTAVSPEDGGLIGVAAAFTAAGRLVGGPIAAITGWECCRRAGSGPAVGRWRGEGNGPLRQPGGIAGGPDHGGEPYKWWRSSSAKGFTTSQRVQFLFEQGAY